MHYGSIVHKNGVCIFAGQQLNKIMFQLDALGLDHLTETFAFKTHAKTAFIIIGPPNLRERIVVRLQEGREVNVPVDLRQDPPAFPEPTDFTWMRNGQPLLRSGLTTTYSNVTFDSVMRSDAGNYTVTATNFLLNDSSCPIS